MNNIFYNPELKTDRSRRHLPHWQQDEKLYFVTFRLADSIPADELARLVKLQEEFELNNVRPFTPEQEKQYCYLFYEQINNWLDNCYGECLLERSENAQIVKNALEYFDGKRYRLDHWVIMPNHLHVILLLNEGINIGDITHSWKSYTGLQINKREGRTGPLWQHESFDHIIRSDFYLNKYRDYIIANKMKANKALLSRSTILVDS